MASTVGAAMIAIIILTSTTTMVLAFVAPNHLQCAREQQYRESCTSTTAATMTSSSSQENDNDHRHRPNTPNNKNHHDRTRSLPHLVQRTMATLWMTATLWTAPAALMQVVPSGSFADNPYVSISTSIVHAKEMASGTGSRVNKDPNSLLRLGLPISNKEVRDSHNTHIKCKICRHI